MFFSLISLLYFNEIIQATTVVFRNGKIFTVDQNLAIVDSLAYDTETGIIISVGSEAQVTSDVANITSINIIDLKGRSVLPGFHDVHIHGVEAGINEEICNIPETTRVKKIPDLLKACPKGGKFGDQGWILGAGIDIGLLDERLWNDPWLEYPIKILDRAYPKDPVLILDNLGHGVLTNSQGLKLVGYNKLKYNQNPAGGKVDRDKRTRKPTGIVRENAQQKLRDAAFPPTEKNKEQAYGYLLNALEKLARNGITTVSDAGGFWRQAQTESWIRAEEEGVLTVRCSNALYVYPDEPIDKQLPKLKKRFSNDRNKLVRFNQAKVYVDGILSMGTAALYDAYKYDKKEYGFEYFGNQLKNTVKKLSSAGFQLHFHVSGDRAASLALDAIEALGPKEFSSEHPTPRLTHLYLVREDDRSRFRELGVVADFQLAPSSLKKGYIDFLKKDILGTTRADTLLPALEIYDTGALITLSSDWDADELSPLIKLRTVTNRYKDNHSIDLITAIEMMTIHGATLLHQDDITGSLEVGKYADMVIIDRNIFEDLENANIEATVFNGNAVYDPLDMLQFSVVSPVEMFSGSPISMSSSPTITSPPTLSSMPTLVTTTASTSLAPSKKPAKKKRKKVDESTVHVHQLRE